MREHPLVLLLDDEKEFLEIASMQLHTEGFETVIAHTFDEALAKAEEVHPDLILSDIYMPPEPNGWDLALAVKRDPKLQGTKIAFFSSLRDPKAELVSLRSREGAAELNDIPVFSKTDDVGILHERIRTLFPS